MFGHRRNAHERAGDFLDPLAHPFGCPRVTFELGELAAQDQQVESFGFLVVVLARRWQAGEVTRSYAVLVGQRRSPHRFVGESLDGTVLRPDEHVLQVHAGDELVQSSRSAFPEIRLDALVVEAGDDVEPCFEQPLRQRFLHRGFGSRDALAEEL